MDYGNVINLVAQLIGYCFPFSLIFGVSVKLYRLAFDFIFNRRVEF